DGGREIDLHLRADVTDVNRRPRPGHLLTENGRQGDRVRGSGTNHKGSAAHGHECALGIDRVERKVCRRPYRAAQVVPGSRVTHKAHDLKPDVLVLEPFPGRILAVEELFRKRLVDDRYRRIRVSGAK